MTTNETLELALQVLLGLYMLSGALILVRCAHVAWDSRKDAAVLWAWRPALLSVAIAFVPVINTVLAVMVIWTYVEGE